MGLWELDNSPSNRGIPLNRVLTISRSTKQEKSPYADFRYLRKIRSLIKLCREQKVKALNPHMSHAKKYSERWNNEIQVALDSCNKFSHKVPLRPRTFTTYYG